MKPKLQLLVLVVLALSLAPLTQAQVQTSRQIPFNGVVTTIAPSTPGQTLTIQLWDAATGGSQLYCENQTLDVDANGAITFNFGAGTAPTPPCASVPPGLDPNNFPSGASRFLDAVDSTGTSVLPNPPGRIPLNAVAFALSPGPQGPQGVPGQQGPPGVVQAVSPGDASILVGGTAANPTVAVAANGITNANVANGALSAAKIAGTAATLGPNMFTGTQTINGDLNATGNLTMVDSTATAGNILKGGALFLHNFGFGNTFIGKNAGNLTMTGQVNTAIGALALANNTIGGSNTASGYVALFSNTTGFNNTATGGDALQSNTTGSGNTAIGAVALFGNTTGNFNTASGFQALQLNTTGNSNTASGVSALQSNTTGGNNTAFGYRALLSNTTGVSNTASGYQALFSNTTGFDNTASGDGALNNNTTGGSNTASGVNALFRNTTGVVNTASGINALQSNTTGSLNTAIGYQADVSAGNLINATAIGANAIVNASNKIRLGDDFVTVIEGRVPYTFTSDKNQKENFQPVEGEEVLRKIGGLSLTSWNYIGHDPKQFRHYGPVAQEFFGAFGHDAIGTIGTSTTINSGDMEGILMVAAQALEKRTVQQSKRLEALRAENADLKARLEETVEVLKAENAALKGRLDKLRRSIGSHALAAKAE